MSSRMQDCIQSVVLQCGGRRISLTGVDLVQSRATSGPPPSCMRLTVILHPSTDNKQLEAGGAARRGVGRSLGRQRAARNDQRGGAWLSTYRPSRPAAASTHPPDTTRAD